MSAPTPIYTAMPVVYFVIGAAALIDAGPWFGRIAGGLLLIATGIIVRARLANRRQA